MPLSFLVITVARTSQQSAAAHSDDEPTRAQVEGRIHSAAQNFLLLLNLTFSVSSRLVVRRRAPREQKRNHRTVFPCCPPRPILPNLGGRVIMLAQTAYSCAEASPPSWQNFILGLWADHAAGQMRLFLRSTSLDETPFKPLEDDRAS